LRNEGVAPDLRMLFRIGINLGDVLIEGDDLLGDGVNVAARLEGIAEPGGICVSSSAYDQVRGRVAVEFADLGEQNLKNIARPVRAYAVVGDSLGGDRQAAPAMPTVQSVPHLSIVVLPLSNIGGDPAQEYFVDGVTESLYRFVADGRQFCDRPQHCLHLQGETRRSETGWARAWRSLCSGGVGTAQRQSHAH